MRLTEMKQALATRGIQLTKSLGQNFLHDTNQVRRIVEAARIEKGDRILEIGPGLGPLTELLVKGAGEVLAIEKDARLVEFLHERFKAVEAAGDEPVPENSLSPKLRLIHADALEYLQHTPRDWGDWKLVSNLPYSVASPILVELAQGARGPKRMVATLQLEVARRLLAKPGEADYGVLTLLVQMAYEPLGWFKISASCFFPEPEVDSACVWWQRRGEPLIEAERQAAFVRIVKRSFSQRRKMMLKLLKTDWPARRLEGAFADLQLAPQARAETVGLEQFIRLTRQLTIDS